MNETALHPTPDNQQTDRSVVSMGIVLAHSKTGFWSSWTGKFLIAKHLRNIFKESELKEQAVSAKFAHATKHGAIEGKT